MKKLIQFFLIGIFMTNQNTYAQITLELTEQYGIYGIVHLSHSGDKYVDYSGMPNYTGNPSPDGPGIHIRNLDGSLYRTLNLPVTPEPPVGPMSLFYVSETLFDTDSTDIEYLLGYYYLDTFNNLQSRTLVADETGAILLSEQFATTYEIFTTGRYYYSVYSTEQGTKLQLVYLIADSITGQYHYLYNKVFSLPGSYPIGINSQLHPPHDFDTFLFPNPSAERANIRLDLPDKISDARIIFYDQAGQLIKQLKINPKDKIITVDNSMLPSGIYFYEVITAPFLKSNSRKMIVVREN